MCNERSRIHEQQTGKHEEMYGLQDHEHDNEQFLNHDEIKQHPGANLVVETGADTMGRSNQRQNDHPSNKADLQVIEMLVIARS